MGPPNKSPKPQSFKIRPVGESFYLKNPRLKRVGSVQTYTQDQVDEWIKCSLDPIYFIRTYCKIVHVDQGVVPFDLYDFQEDIIESYFCERKVIVKLSRQMGKTTTTAAFFLWYVLFQDNKVCAILANKAPIAQEILNRIQMMYEHIPSFLQQSVVEWNKRSITLENHSRILAAATSSSAIRGYSLSCVAVQSTLVTVRNKITGAIKTCTIGELIKEQESINTHRT